MSQPPRSTNLLSSPKLHLGVLDGFGRWRSGRWGEVEGPDCRSLRNLRRRIFLVRASPCELFNQRLKFVVKTGDLIAEVGLMPD